MRRAILLFLKYPEPGRVKTRLAASLGAREAAVVYRELVAAVWRQLPSSGETIIVVYDPPERKDEVERWLGELPPNRKTHFHPQAEGDLGDRLECAFCDAFTAGFEQVTAVGTDCIDLSPGIFAATWSALRCHDVVLGPASDGGYYLLALKSPAPGLFREVAWSTDAVLSQTLTRAGDNGLSVSLLPELSDVDTEDDWRRVEARLNP